jgi:F420-dependent oxidoreductase-like protein
MRLSMSIGHGGGFDRSVDRIEELERAGLDMAWVGEAYGLDAPTQLGYLAARTTRLELGAGILNLYSRAPTLIAQTAAGLDYVSDGRAVLGIGSSGAQVIEGFYGVPFDRPLLRTRELIDICHQVWDRQPVVHDGAYQIPLPAGQGTGLGKPIKLAAHPVRPRIPIYVAALGPKNVALTAEWGDGWLTTLFIPELAKTVWGDAIEDGIARRPEELGPLEILAGGAVAIGEDVTDLREQARPTAARYIGGMGARGHNYYNDLVCRYGFESEARRVQDLYLDGHRADAEAAVPDEFLEKTSLVGPPGYIKERLAAYKEAGVTVLSITPVGGDPVAVVTQLREWMA